MRVRAAILGYLGHMWEFVAFWSWVGVFAAASYGSHMERADAIEFGKLTAFLCILAASPACILTGMIADSWGKARIAAVSLAVSGTAAVLSALTFGGPTYLTFGLLIVWGAAVVPDSPQFSSIVADNAPSELVGSLLTFQASLGFLLTVLTVHMAPYIANIFGWPILIGILALGSVFGLVVSRPLLQRSPADGTSN